MIYGIIMTFSTHVVMEKDLSCMFVLIW